MSPTFPNVQIRRHEGSRSVKVGTITHEALSGRKVVDQIWQSPRATEALTAVLRDNVLITYSGASFTEKDALEQFWSDVGGNAGTFYLSLLAGTSTLVRFADDTLEFDRTAAGLWECTFNVETVI